MHCSILYDINFVNFGETLTRNIFRHNITEILLKAALNIKIEYISKYFDVHL